MSPTFRRLFLPLSLLLVLGTTLACGPSGDGDGSDAPSGERQFLSVGTAPPGGAFFVVGGALAEVLDTSTGEGVSEWRVTAEATKGTQENIRRLARGELDLALANSAITYFAVRGEEGWESEQPVAAVMTLAPNVALFLTPEGSGVETLGDLAGERVVVGPAGAGFEYFLRPILEAHGVGYGDFTPLNSPQGEAVNLLADGSAAAAFLGGAVPTASITQATTSQDIRFLPFDPAAVDGLVERYPFFQRAVIPGGTYRNQPDDFAGMDVGSMHLIAAADADEDLIYQVTRTLYEERDRVIEKHPAGRAIGPGSVRDTGTPFHPGAIRYYREIGVWPAEGDDGAGDGDGETEDTPEGEVLEGNTVDTGRGADPAP